MKIDLFTFLTKNSADYAEFLKYTAKKNLSGKHKVNWKCIKSVGCERIPKGFECVAKGPDTGHGGYNHAAAIHKALKKITEEYVILVDSDIAILYKGWDDVIVNELNNYDCFGVAQRNIGGRYLNFPTTYLFAFRSYILNKVELDFRPYINSEDGTDRKYTFILNREEAEIFGREEGYKLKCDIGWRLPLLIKNAGFTNKSLPAVLAGQKGFQLPYENPEQKRYCENKFASHMYEWHYKGRLFVSHRHAGRKSPLDSKNSIIWKKRVELYIKRIGHHR